MSGREFLLDRAPILDRRKVGSDQEEAEAQEKVVEVVVAEVAEVVAESCPPTTPSSQ